MRLTQRLLLGALLVVGFLAALIVVVVDRQFTARLGDDATTFLARESRLVGQLWEREPEAPDALADRTGEALGRRVTLVGPDGVVLGDSEFDDAALTALQNHATRPEIAEAIRTGTGIARRPSPSTGTEELYVAVAIPSRGVARVSLPTASLNAIIASARRDITTAALLALAGALLIALVFSRSVSRPVEELRDVAQALADGDLERRPTLRAPGEVGDLAVALRRLAEQLSARLRALRADETLLVQLTESLNEGVIAIGTGGTVVRINETARRLLGVRAPLPFSVDLLPREVTLRDAMSAAFAGETTDGAEVVIAGRTLNVTARPLSEGGAVLALFDLTRVRRLEAVRRDFVRTSRTNSAPRSPSSVASRRPSRMAMSPPRHGSSSPSASSATPVGCSASWTTFSTSHASSRGAGYRTPCPCRSPHSRATCSRRRGMQLRPKGSR